MVHKLFDFFLQIFFPLPPLASQEGQRIDFVLYLVHVLMLMLLVGWGVFFIYVLWRFHERKNSSASYRGLSNRLSLSIEIAIALAEAMLLIGISIPFWSNYMVRVPNGKDVIHLKVVAEQFAWDVHYPGPDGKFGRTDLKFYDPENNPLGLDPDDSNGKDDFVTINVMHLPIGTPVVIDLTSKDVIHSFTLPEMRVKRDVIPGMMIQTWFTPIKAGSFDIACSQLCGIGHYRMKGVLIIESPKAFKHWVDSKGNEGIGNDTMKYIANP